MLFPVYEELSRIGRGFRQVPLAYRMPWGAHIDPLESLRMLHSDLTGSVLLESGRAGKYSYLAYEPLLRVMSKNGETVVEKWSKQGSVSSEKILNQSPLHVLRDQLQAYKTPHISGMPDFTGGAMGYLSYEMNRHFEHSLQHLPIDDLQLPQLYVMIYQDLIAFDHDTKECFLLTHVSAEADESEYNLAAERLLHLSEKLSNVQAVTSDQNWEELRKKPLSTPEKVDVSFEQEEFEEAVRAIQAYIAAGDVFQVNLSVRQSAPLAVSADAVYETLRKLNPSPYKGYLHFPEFQIVSGSPELLIKVQQGEVSTRPIAGTRPRGKTDEEDEALAKELLMNEKERAEHVMLVDLERNDMGRVCKYGSVEVTELMVVEKYSHVMHIVSHIKGELDDDKDAFDAIAAAFPGGTITGAPKVRTMEIIEELEKVQRGVYTGSIGWFGFDGDVELNIVIRTMVVKDQIGYIQAGAGIVIDSEPEAEYHESLKKAEAMWKAVELSEEFEMKRHKCQEES
ncbi:anthranilate synthase component I family protein [Brevibacillus daliensis]|uniref:anthranilate synthase component I family protein n=1 Tax=Brevibacillus daliensis TaxID=2892995 RepID=UPI001E350BBB|nr:anthranilate synthase component I family protein [Brevibacillus daliensis]